MKKNTSFLYICTALTLGLVCLTSAWYISKRQSGHWEWYTISEYKFKEPQIKDEFTNWIESLNYADEGNATNSKRMDFDFCLLQCTDTIWNALQTAAVDTFNSRLHTHSYRNNYLRQDTFCNLIKGYVRLGTHAIFLYDDITISRLFTPRGKTAHLCRYIQEEHGFLDWQDEDIWVAYTTEQHLRPIDTQGLSFYHNEFLFYHPSDIMNQSALKETIDADTFICRTQGPYLMLSVNDEMNSEQTKNNLLKIFQKNLTQKELDTISSETRITLICRVDSLGNITILNNSTPDITEGVCRICKQIPSFIPAKERGRSVNSILIVNYCMKDFIK